ncbi:hypothetical protein [Enteractinococcus helveticum]|nr:hypothetical protein [Enteractinococcus helveticum]
MDQFVEHDTIWDARAVTSSRMLITGGINASNWCHMRSIDE